MNTKLCVPRHGGFLLGVLDCSYPVSLGTVLPTVCTLQGLCVSMGSDAYAEHHFLSGS